MICAFGCSPKTCHVLDHPEAKSLKPNVGKPADPRRKAGCGHALEPATEAAAAQRGAHIDVTRSASLVQRSLLGASEWHNDGSTARGEAFPAWQLRSKCRHRAGSACSHPEVPNARVKYLFAESKGTRIAACLRTSRIQTNNMHDLLPEAISP